MNIDFLLGCIPAHPVKLFMTTVLQANEKLIPFVICLFPIDKDQGLVRTDTMAAYGLVILFFKQLKAYLNSQESEPIIGYLWTMVA